MNTSKEVKVLPNPDGVWITKDTLLTRQQCVKECIGCQKQFDTGSDEVCIPYADPKAMWRKFRTEEVNLEGKVFELTLDPCPMATHVQHRPLASFFTKKGNLNPIKMSKRK